MELNRLELHSFLVQEGIKYLYHANTVQTACTFIEQGGLLSRGLVEDKYLIQTPQQSDKDDKAFNVWYDIFLDNHDLHASFNRQNKYGPVLFKISIDILKDKSIPPIWITKDNPIFWKESQHDNERYYQDLTELKSEYNINSYKQMITLRFAHTPLFFKDNLIKIIYDNPGVKCGETHFYQLGKDALSNAIKNSKFDYSNVARKVRDCKPNECYCKDNYLREVTCDTLRRYYLVQ
ncbi:hypothetical protein [Bacillus atrophaeus]|uniref:hypothetical protein n=1 Tax=Bacillus atrophaeus TaxID=1452 RepID=UPI0022820DA6|nr:hypothetical protein [Bacillus atrophaeus]MCY8859094.1 hypothetical protein [Bacillus atrophaeus]